MAQDFGTKLGCFDPPLATIDVMTNVNEGRHDSFHTMAITERPCWMLPIDYYLRYVMAPTMYFIHTQKAIWYGFLGLVSLFFIGFTVWGALNLVDEPRDLHTFQKIEHDPTVPALLMVAAHITLAMFAEKMYSVYGRPRPDIVETGDHRVYKPPSPILYPFFCGKAFMLLRLIMAYHSGDLGECIDYFFYQEIILIVIHILISCMVLPHFGDNPLNATSMNRMIWLITFMDLFKTVVMLGWYLQYTPGAIKLIFDRLPNSGSQIAATLSIHAFLDILQNLASVFTVWIARASATIFLCGCEPLGIVEDDNVDYNGFTDFNLFWFDSYWCELLFIDDNYWLKDQNVRNHCRADMDMICGKKGKKRAHSDYSKLV